jgi:hypothetical protein
MFWVSLVILLLNRALITFISLRTWVSVYVATDLDVFMYLQKAPISFLMSVHL